MSWLCHKYYKWLTIHIDKISLHFCFNSITQFRVIPHLLIHIIIQNSWQPFWVYDDSLFTLNTLLVLFIYLRNKNYIIDNNIDKYITLRLLCDSLWFGFTANCCLATWSGLIICSSWLWWELHDRKLCYISLIKRIRIEFV